MLFTGGWKKEGQYFDIVKEIFKKTIEKNDAGDIFPLLAICLGFQLLTMIAKQGNKRSILDWQSRQKIAIGAERGLRYLHEDCRVGSILHRDLRPSNILLTRDYEPLVADFGLATLHTEWDICERVVGTAGYLAPEYFIGGKITEKVDIYAFGFVLLELNTGEKASNLLYNGQHLGESCPPFSSPSPDLIGPLFTTSWVHKLPQEVHTMGHAAFFCLQQDPDLRPTISKVLRIREGYCMVPLGADDNGVGSSLIPICRFQPDLLEKLITNCLVLQSHHHGISLETFQGNADLCIFFNILSISTDSNHNDYVSTVQAHIYPITGFQWHPEHLTEAARRSSNSQFHGEGEKRKEMEKYFGNAYRGDPGVPHADADRFTNIWIGSFAFSALTWVNPYMWQLSNQMKTYGGYSWPAIQICSTFEACKWIFQEDVWNGQAACPWENVSST